MRTLKLRDTESAGKAEYGKPDFRPTQVLADFENPLTAACCCVRERTLQYPAAGSTVRTL